MEPRIDQNLGIAGEPDRWVHSACLLCSNGCGLDFRRVRSGDQAKDKSTHPTQMASATRGGTQRTVRWPIRVEVAVCSDSGEAIGTVFTGWVPASSARSTSTSVPSSAITLRSC
jgi:BRCT domain type II-containing protein